MNITFSTSIKLRVSFPSEDCLSNDGKHSPFMTSLGVFLVAIIALMKMSGGYNQP